MPAAAMQKLTEVQASMMLSGGLKVPVEKALEDAISSKLLRITTGEERRKEMFPVIN